jgi:hypothetical protein
VPAAPVVDDLRASHAEPFGDLARSDQLVHVDFPAHGRRTYRRRVLHMILRRLAHSYDRIMDDTSLWTVFLTGALGGPVAGSFTVGAVLLQLRHARRASQLEWLRDAGHTSSPRRCTRSRSVAGLPARRMWAVRSR